MQNNYFYNITASSVVLFKTGKRLVAHSSHPNFRAIIDRIKNKQYNNIERLFEIKRTIEKVFNVQIVDGKEVRYNGNLVHSGVSKQILDFIKMGIPHRPLVKFLNKLMQNPSQASRDSLYSYIGDKYLPITEDGDFIACKAIRKDWLDIHSGKVSNRVGETVMMKRSDVNPSSQECAGSGLHVGSSEYIKAYGGAESKYIMVKINPRDVVVVPQESGYGKIRVCRYKVIREVSLDQIDFTSPYAPNNSNYKEIARIKGPKRDNKGRFVSVN